MEREYIYQLIGERATCRSYRPDPIPEEVLNRVLEAGCKSPSSGGFQALSIIKVTDPAKRNKLAQLCRGQNFIATAPVSLVLCIDYHRMERIIAMEPAPFREPDLFSNLWMGIWDAAICAQTMVLAAQAEGLGSCYIGNLLNRMGEASVLLGLPNRVCPAVMLTLGWPKTVRKQPPKYPPSILVHENEYQELPDEVIYSAYRKQNRYQKLPPKAEHVQACCQMARALHGEDYARQVRADIEKKGYLSPYQYWFGCWYTDEPEFLDWAGYRAYFVKQGFHWLEEKETTT
ncbi:MAG: nitroreductase family protein [Clostridium sp.]|nr:nitroreductase family protein [Clostridium sp.]